MGVLYKAWRYFQERLIGSVAAVVFLIASVFACTEFITRYLVGHTFHWGQDAVTHGIIAATFLYFGASQAKRAHLTLTILPDWLKGNGQHRLAAVINAVACAVVVIFCAMFVYYGLPGAERTWRTGRMTESMIIPLWPFQYALLVGMGMLGVTAAFQLYQEILRVFGRTAYPGEPEDEEFEL
ncbi:MAG: TRAP transporter small permease [Hyphomicrobiaceae bacterium]